MSADHKLILEKANEAVAKGDNEGFLNFCTDDVQWTFVGDKVLRGKEEVRQYMASAYVEPPKFTVKNLIGENDFVTAIGSITLTNNDGKAVHYSYCDVWRFREGKLSELTAFVIETSAT